MKKSILAACSVLAFAGCKEVGPTINFGTSTGTDSTYVLSTVPAAAPHNVLVEEFTGQGCANCPAAHAELDAIANANQPGRVNVMGLYITNFEQTVPNTISKHDFRTSDATQIASLYGGVGSLPSGGVDRLVDNGSMLMLSSVWANEINTQLKVTDSLNLAVQSSYNATTTVATVTVTVTYTSAVPYAQNLNVAVVEDSMVDIQEEPPGIPPYVSGYDTTYLFTDVFRGMASSLPAGDVISTPDKNPGRVYRRIYSYTLPALPTSPYDNPPVNASHCRVIAFVTNNGSNGTVAQSAQTPLVGQ